LKQSRDVLADVMPARSFPEIRGSFVIMLERQAGDFFQILRVQRHGPSCFAPFRAASNDNSILSPHPRMSPVFEHDLSFFAQKLSLVSA